MIKWRDEAILDVYKLVLSVFLFLTPWFFAFAHGTARVEIWTSGLLLALTSCAAIVAFAKWEEWISLLLGIWITAAPWVFNFQHTTAAKISVGVGCVVAFLAALGMVAAKAGGADVLKPTIRVTFWGAFAMALTAGIGALVGKAI